MPKAKTLKEAKQMIVELEKYGEKWYYRKSPWDGYIVQRRPHR
jgi:hypothetical protein